MTSYEMMLYAFWKAKLVLTISLIVKNSISLDKFINLDLMNVSIYFKRILNFSELTWLLSYMIYNTYSMLCGQSVNEQLKT